MGLSKQDIDDRLKQCYGNDVSIVWTSYINTTKKADFIDVKYGPFTSYVNKVIRGAKHPKRARVERDMTNIDKYLSNVSQDYEKRFLDRLSQISDIDMLDEYQGSRTKIRFLDRDYGIFMSTPMHILRGQGHPERAKSKRRSTNLKKFGTASPAANPKVQQKIRETMLSRYGVDNYTQTEEYKQRMVQSNKIRLLPWGQTIVDFYEEQQFPFALSTVYRVTRQHPDINKEQMIVRCNEIGAGLVSENIARRKLEQLTGKSFPKIRIQGYELDGYCEELQLAFEYDGYQHFEQTWYDKSDEALKKRQTRDCKKDKLCQELGIQLIRIPHTVPCIETYIEEQYHGG